MCHISEDGLAAKIPNDLQFISLSKFFIAKPILFSSNCFFKNNMYFQIRILTDMQKKVLSAIFFTKIHFHAEMSFNVSQLIHMNGSCAICRQSTFSRGVLMFCSWFMMLNDWHCLWTTLGWTHPRINFQQGGLLVVTNVILTSHSQDLNTLLTTWGPTYIQMQSRCVESKQKKTSTIVMNYLVRFGNDQSLCGPGRGKRIQHSCEFQEVRDGNRKISQAYVLFLM